MSWTRIATVAVIAVTFFRRQVRNPAALAMAFLTPVLIAVVFGYADQRAHSTLPIGVTYEENDGLAVELVDNLRSEAVLHVRTFADERTLENSVRRGDLYAGVIIPPDYGQRADENRDLGVRVIGEESRSAFIAARSAVTLVIDSERQVLDEARRLASQQPSTMKDAVKEARARASAVDVAVQRTTAARSTRATGIGRASAGMLLYFMLHLSLYQAYVFVGDRQRGLIERMTTSGATPAEVVGGELGGRVAFLAFQAVGVVGITALFFEIRWGDPAGILVALALFIVVSAGVGMIVGCRRRASVDDPALARIGAAAVLALLGGCFFSLQQAPDWMRITGHFTPHGWAMDAFETLIGTSAGIASAARPLLVLTAFAVVLLAVAVWRMRRLAYV